MLRRMARSWSMALPFIGCWAPVPANTGSIPPAAGAAGAAGSTRSDSGRAVAGRRSVSGAERPCPLASGAVVSAAVSAAAAPESRVT